MYPNFRDYGHQITYEPWRSGMSRIRHHIPDENWPTCQNQLILFHISYLQLSSLSQFVPIPHGWLWIPKILPGSLFHAEFFAQPSPPPPSLGFCTAGSCLECPLHMPNLSDFRSQLKVFLAYPALWFYHLWPLFSFKTFITACTDVFVWFLVWFRLV